MAETAKPPQAGGISTAYSDDSSTTTSIFRDIERKWQKKWFDEDKTFEPASIASNKSSTRKFFLTVPYPYVSGALHIGHGRTYTNADVFCRYKRMTGLNVLWPMAFHITGTPVLAISNALAEGDRKTIELYKSYVGLYETDPKRIDELVASFNEPWNIVRYFADKISNDFKSIGFSIDWSRTFTTADKEYNALVTWQFRKYKEKGFLVQAEYPILYCVSDKNAVGEDDIKDGDTDPVEVQEFTSIKFKLSGSPDAASLLASTFRPETVFGVTNVFVNPESKYSLIELEKSGEKWIVSSACLGKLSMQNKQFRVVVDEFEGRYLVGKEVIAPTGAKIPVLPASFVSPDAATGVVYSVPAHAPYDYIGIEDLRKNEPVLREYGIKELVERIKPITIIKSPGFGALPAGEACKSFGVTSQGDADALDNATKAVYKAEYYEGVLLPDCGKFAGLKVKDVKPEIISWLKEMNASDSLFEPSRDAYCRCGGRIIVACLSDQWFLDFNAAGWKDASRECLAGMNIIPESYRKQFEATLNWLDKRPCARRRGLGTPLPFNKEWIIESLSDSTIYMSFYAIIKKARELGIKSEQMDFEEFFDYVYLGRGTVESASAKTKVPKENLDAVRNEFLYWYPNDHRHTAIAHVANHLTFFIMAHAAIFPKALWPKCISLNDMLVRDGVKMSKSKGNVIPLIDVGRRYSADLYRLYMASAADLDSVIDWREGDVDACRKALKRFFDTASEMIENRSDHDGGDLKSLSPPCKAFISKFEKAVGECGILLEDFRIRDYVNTAFYKVLNDYSSLAHRIQGSPELKTVNNHVVGKWVRLLCPVIPHACEELWAKLGGVGFASKAEWPISQKELVDDNIEAVEEYVESVASDVRNILSFVKTKEKGPSRVCLYAASNWKARLRSIVIENKEKPFGEIIKQAIVEGLPKEGVSKLTQEFYKKKMQLEPLPKMDEVAALKEHAEVISRALGGLRIAVYSEEDPLKHDPVGKAAAARPGKPGILVE